MVSGERGTGQNDRVNMSLFQAVKEVVDTREAAEVYGLEVNNSGMAICPFHDDNNPSMKVDERYHCFACQADGDVIDFVANYFELSKIDAVKKIAKDFGIEYQSVGYKKQKSVKQINRHKPIRKEISVDDEFNKRIRTYNNILCEYKVLLESYKTIFKPSESDEDLHPLFVKAITNLDRIDYLIIQTEFLVTGKSLAGKFEQNAVKSQCHSKTSS